MTTFRFARLALLAAAALAFASTGANAGWWDRDGGRGSIKDGPYSRVETWSGFHVGVNAGGAWTDLGWDNVSLTGEPIKNDSSGFIGGGQIGYDWQLGQFVVGVEASLSGTSLSDTANSAVPGITFSTDINWLSTITGRVGYASDRWLIYVKGGWASAGMTLKGNNPGAPDSFSKNHTADGWVIGTGAEYRLTHNVSLGLEYSFIDLGKDNVFGTTAAALPYVITGVDTQIQSVTARLNFRF
jgi:outer membrane immunogenic protein